MDVQMDQGQAHEATVMENTASGKFTDHICIYSRPKLIITFLCQTEKFSVERFHRRPMYGHGISALRHNWFLPSELCCARYMPWPCVCLSVSDTSRCSTKMAKHLSLIHI